MTTLPIIITVRGTQEQLQRFKHTATRVNKSLNQLTIHLLELCAKYPEIITYKQGDDDMEGIEEHK